MVGVDDVVVEAVDVPPLKAISADLPDRLVENAWRENGYLGLFLLLYHVSILDNKACIYKNALI